MARAVTKIEHCKLIEILLLAWMIVFHAIELTQM